MTVWLDTIVIVSIPAYGAGRSGQGSPTVASIYTLLAMTISSRAPDPTVADPSHQRCVRLRIQLR